MNPWAMGMAIWQAQLAAMALQMDLARLALGAPMVMAQRFTKAGRDYQKPDFALDPEWQRMVTEKTAAALAAQRQLWLYALRSQGKPLDMVEAITAARRSMRPYGRKVQANVRRLSR